MNPTSIVLLAFVTVFSTVAPAYALAADAIEISNSVHSVSHTGNNGTHGAAGQAGGQGTVGSDGRDGADGEDLSGQRVSTVAVTSSVNGVVVSDINQTVTGAATSDTAAHASIETVLSDDAAAAGDVAPTVLSSPSESTAMEAALSTDVEEAPTTPTVISLFNQFIGFISSYVSIF